MTTTAIQTTKPGMVAGVSLPPRVSSQIRETRGVESGAVISYEFHNAWDLAVYDVEDIKSAYISVCKDIEFNSVPLDRTAIAMRLTDIYAVCAKPASAEGSLELEVDAFGRRLQEHPGYIVRQVLLEWPDRNTFRPTWDKLLQEINNKNEKLKLKYAIRGMLRNLGLSGADMAELEG